MLITGFVLAGLCLFEAIAGPSQRNVGFPISQTVSEISLKVETAKKDRVYSKSEPVVLKFSVTNNAKKTIYLHESCPTLDYRLVVRGEDGSVPKLTSEGLRMTNRNEVICKSRKLRVDSTSAVYSTLNVGALFELSANRSYSVIVKRSIYLGSGKWDELISDPIKIQIL
jgi:hypothetical protein